MKSTPRRVSVAPMMDWTDRHCRSFHRLISRDTWLYTEMVTTGALLYGDVARHLAFTPAEAPVALQLGGSEPADLAKSAKLGEQWGYDEINLNCGCPSERVQRGAFGACLMNEPQLVADCVKAMRDAVAIPVTVKHRIGVDAAEEYEFVRDFVGTVAEAGCEVFIVHARNAILKGLSPKENREIPPLNYEYAYRLKRDFPQLEISINGGIKTLDEVEEHLKHVDGVMLGREAYHNPLRARGRRFALLRRAVADRDARGDRGRTDRLRTRRACARHVPRRDHAACARAVSGRRGGSWMASGAVGQQAAGDRRPLHLRRGAQHLREAVELAEG